MSTHEDDDRDDDQPESGLRPVQAPLIQHDRAPAKPADEEFDIVETDDQGKPIGAIAPREEENLSEAQGGNQPVIRQQDDGQGGDRRPREPKSQRNARRRESRERTYAENQRLERENADLKARMDALEGSVKTQLEPRLLELGEGQIRQQAARVDAAIGDAATAARAARLKMATAMSSADNEMLTEALEERDKAIIRETQLRTEKGEIDKLLESAKRAPAADRRADGDGRDRQPVRREAAPLTTRVQQYVQDFGRDHDWYNPADVNDVDSQTVLAIDRAVANAGFDPGTQDYWDEVQDRMKEKLPWHFREDGGEQRQDGQRRDGQPARERQQTPRDQQRRGPPTGGPSDRGNGGGRKTVTISPQRKDAMIQAGAIDNQGRVLDKPKYQRLLKSYDEFDRTNAVR